MRADMAKVVTERPRRGHHSDNEKHGGRLHKDEIWREQEDDALPGGLKPWSRYRNRDRKEFSDLLGPLRNCLRKQVGRPWDKVWSELCAVLDKRTVSGLHIIDHVKSEVQMTCWMGVSGTVYERSRYGNSLPVAGLYVHPMTGLLCYKPERHWRGDKALQAKRAALSPFGVGGYGSTKQELQVYRVDGLRLWEKTAAGWFIHTYKDMPEQRLERLQPPSRSYPLGRTVYTLIPAHRERVSTKQASKKEIRDARKLLEQSF